MTIHVTPHLGVEVVVPRRTPAREVQRFVSKHLDWIEETEEELANTTPAFDRGLPLEIVLPAIDQVWRVSYRRSPERKLRLCERPGNVLELSGPVQDEEACRVRLRQWLTEIARETLAPWLERISERTGLVYRTLQIRGQRTRWGSCSTQRTISLNYSLLFLARPLVRYLLVHELCHTRHMNHGARSGRSSRAWNPRLRRWTPSSATRGATCRPGPPGSDDAQRRPSSAEEQVGVERRARLDRVTVEAAHAFLAQHLLVDEEIPRAAAAVARDDGVRRVGDDVGMPAVLGIDAATEHDQGRRRDHRARPQRIDGDAVVGKLGRSPSTHMLIAYFEIV
jgi:predicted metal-dependent hydrolase